MEASTFPQQVQKEAALPGLPILGGPLFPAGPACRLTLFHSAPPLSGPVSQLLGVGLLDAGTFLEAGDQVPAQPMPVFHPLHCPPVVAGLGHI